jgi:hypothetical protein
VSDDGLDHLVALLSRLEESLPFVTVDELCSHWLPDGAPGSTNPPSAEDCRAVVLRGIQERWLFTDLRQLVDAETATRRSVRLVRLNRRHPMVSVLLPD